VADIGALLIFETDLQDHRDSAAPSSRFVAVQAVEKTALYVTGLCRSVSLAEQ